MLFILIVCVIKPLDRGQVKSEKSNRKFESATRLANVDVVINEFLLP